MGAVLTFILSGIASILLVVTSSGLVAFAVATAVALVPLPLYAWAILINSTVEAVLMVTVTSTSSDALAATLVAPVVEESGKAVVLVLLYRRFHHQISGPLDGIVHAAMVGLGFATVENVLSYGTSVASGDLPLVFVLRGVLSPFAHPVFTAFTGIGLGLLASGRTRLGVLAPVLGLLVAMLVHGLWNGSSELEAYGVLGVLFGIMVPILFGLLVLCRKEASREKRTVREQLRTEVEAGVLSETDVAVLSDVQPRKRLIKAARAMHPHAGAARGALGQPVQNPRPARHADPPTLGSERDRAQRARARAPGRRRAARRRDRPRGCRIRRRDRPTGHAARGPAHGCGAA